MATKKTKQPRLTLHYLLGALSFWGSSVRIMLLAFLALAVLIAHLVVTPSSYGTELSAFIYIVGSIFALDAGYVMLARAFPLRRATDIAALLVAELVIGLAYIMPNLANFPGLSWMANWSLLIVIFVLAIRGLVGLLLAKPRKM